MSMEFEPTLYYYLRTLGAWSALPGTHDLRLEVVPDVWSSSLEGLPLADRYRLTAGWLACIMVPKNNLVGWTTGFRPRLCLLLHLL
jgi:hypothetical protein